MFTSEGGQPRGSQDDADADGAATQAAPPSRLTEREEVLLDAVRLLLDAKYAAMAAVVSRCGAGPAFDARAVVDAFEAYDLTRGALMKLRRELHG